jgi:RNase P/RNase MRP subunit p29
MSSTAGDSKMSAAKRRRCVLLHVRMVSDTHATPLIPATISCRIDSLKAKQQGLVGSKRPSPSAAAPAPVAAAASTATASGRPQAAASSDAYKPLEALGVPEHLHAKLRLQGSEANKGSAMDLLEDVMQQNMPLATAQSMLSARILDKQVMLSNPTASLPQGGKALQAPRSHLAAALLSRPHRLALSTLPAHIPPESLAPLTALWGDYTSRLLQDKPNKQQYSLQHADWHGASMSVVSSRAPQYQGLQGVVVKANRNSLVLVGQDGRPRTLPLQGVCLQCMLPDGSQLLLEGTQLMAARRPPSALGRKR